VTLTVNDAAAVLLGDSIAVTVDGPTKLAITGPTSLVMGTCSTAYSVVTQNASSVPTNVAVSVIANLTGAGAGTFYSDSVCTTVVTSVTILAGTSSTNFYFRDNTVEVVALTATDAASVLTPGTLVVSITPPVAVLTISDGPTFDYGTVSTGAASDHTFTVSNTGAATATAMAAGTPALVAPFSYTGGAYPGTGGTCTTTLAAAATCTIVVRFAPTVVATFSDTVRVSYNNNSVVTEATVGVTGTSTSVIAGDLDTSFGGTGTVTNSINGYFPSIVRDVKIQTDGKIVVVGYAQSVNDWDFALARYNSDGTLDTTFGGTGVIVTGFNVFSNDYAIDSVIQTDGRIVVAGLSVDSLGNSFMALSRYNSNGSLDTTFGSSGLVTTAFGNFFDDEAWGVALQTDGKIVVTGVSDGDFAVVRYNSNGSIDTSFGVSGIQFLFTNTGVNVGRSVAIQTDGKIVAVGYAANAANDSSWLMAVRLNTNGTLDTTFDTNGVQVVAIDSSWNIAESVAIQADGKILMGGYYYSLSSGRYINAVVRLTTVGALDATFGTGGTASVSVGTGQAFGQDLAIQADGRILLVGFTSNDEWEVIRLNANGSADTSFSTDGIVTLTPGQGYAVAIQSDAKIVIAGTAFDALAVARLFP